jgi:hypothetical protein
MSKPKNMTQEEDSAWRMRVRASSRASYQRNRAKVIAKVGEYKRRKSAAIEKPERRKAALKKSNKCKCGRRVIKNPIVEGTCRNCNDANHHKMRLEYRAKELQAKNSILRKWYKWICKRDKYEKSVHVCGTVSSEQYYWELRGREVLERVDFKPVKRSTNEREPLKGLPYDSWSDRDCGVIVDGYYRLRTDRGYYPWCGAAGIPHPRMSGEAKHFEDKYWAGIQRGKEIRDTKARQKATESRERARCSCNLRAGPKASVARATKIKTKKEDGRSSRYQRERRNALMFFQMNAAASELAEFFQNQTHQKA